MFYYSSSYLFYLSEWSHSNSRDAKRREQSVQRLRGLEFYSRFRGKDRKRGRASAADIFESAPLTFLIRDTGRPVRHLV